MSRKLNIVQRKAHIVRGVDQTSFMMLNDLTDVVDPLNDTANINKPAASIPSMFARMLFFRTAFQSAAQDPLNTGSVYAKFVSDCLDLLEMIFNHEPGLEIVRWNKATQLTQLANNHFNKLHDALDSQTQKFIPNVNDIFLFIKSDPEQGQVLLGGTSPFSLVFTSPNWNNTKNTTLLVSRSKVFREFLYKFAVTQPANGSLGEFINFILASKQYDDDFRNVNYAGLWNTVNLATAYPVIQCVDGKNSIDVTIYPGVLSLHGRDNNAITSDLFIDSKLQEFNPSSSPLFIAVQSYYGLNYCDGDLNFTLNDLTEQENVNDQQRQIPEKTFQHLYFTKIDFLEDKLISVPGVINSNTWHCINNGNKSYFLPFKPKLFKYFRLEDLNFSYECIDQIIKIRLSIPVKNEDETVKHVIIIEKNYELANNKDVEMLRSYSIGVSPFYKTNKYYAIQQCVPGNYSYSLSFYNYGNKDSIQGIAGVERTRDGVCISTHYDIQTSFDYINLSTGGVNAILIPKFKDIQNGASTYAYGVDFGTTNTHIAYLASGGGNPISFERSEFEPQVEYLYADGGDGGDGTFVNVSAREFLPYTKDEQCTFPIRTVTSEHDLNIHSKLFESVSIGFLYSRDININDAAIYSSTLKWDFDNINGGLDTNVVTRVKIFCEEILWIIKNHWMLEPNADHNVCPVLWLTYPKVMNNWNLLKDIWVNAYSKVFNVTLEIAQDNIKEVTESLAPCQQNITHGHVPTGGILNVDIGGGTTDIQYYANHGADEIAYYNSIKFAGDDLWGICFENEYSNAGNAITSNHFTDYADKNLANAVLRIGYSDVNIKQIKYPKPKEKIGCLFKDSNNCFAISLQTVGFDNICKKIMYIHYSSIIWYVSKWMLSCGLSTIPKCITFTGMGSKYLKILFNGDDNTLNIMTKALIEKFTGLSAKNVTAITLSPQPKKVTAEGAVSFQNVKTPIPTSIFKYYIGCDIDTTGQITYKDITNLNIEDKVIDSLSGLIEDLVSLRDLNGQVNTCFTFTMSDSEKEIFLQNAKTSFEHMYSLYVTDDTKVKTVNDALLFWALKGSLYKL